MYIINFILQLQNWHPFALTQRYIFRETTVLKTSLHSPGSLKVVKFTTHFLNKFFPSLHISISQSRLEHFINTSLFISVWLPYYSNYLSLIFCNIPDSKLCPSVRLSSQIWLEAWAPAERMHEALC